MRDEHVEEEGADVVGDGFGVEEELGEEGEVLREERVRGAVEGVDGDGGLSVDGCAESCVDVLVRADFLWSA